MNMYDSMIITNIVEFCRWIRMEKGIHKPPRDPSELRELAKEFVNECYHKEG